jgi:hypothetical protein
MNNFSRFNLSLLRRRGSSKAKSIKPSGPVLSRRAFLTLSGASIAASALPPLFRGDGFSIVREEKRLHVLTDNIIQWTIDPAHFGENASLDVERRVDFIVIALRNAVFAGTTLPANFRCELTRSLGKWSMALFILPDLSLSADWLDWLHGRRPAMGRWQARNLRPIKSFSLSLPHGAIVQFKPDWTFHFAGETIARVAGFDQAFSVANWQLLSHRTASIGFEPAGSPSTSFQLTRDGTPWLVTLTRSAKQGWRLDHDRDEELFDELQVEAQAGARGPVHTALLTQSDANTNALRFFPGGGLSTTFGDPFHLKLLSPRLAFSLSEPVLQSALLADFDPETTWAHTDYLSLAFSSSPEGAPFELLETGTSQSTPSATPCVAAIQTAGPSDTCTKLTFDSPRPTPFTWSKFVQPFERFLGYLHFLPWEHFMAFDLTAGDTLSVYRPDDMLTLKFAFQNMRLHAGLSSKISPTDPHLKAIPPGTPSVTVTFPPQHVNEQAFFHTDDDPNKAFDLKQFKVGKFEIQNLQERSAPDGKLQNATISAADAAKLFDPDAPSNNSVSSSDGDALPTPGATTSPTVARMSGESTLAFTFPPDQSIPFHLENLLDWSSWTPQVHDVAKTNVVSAKDAASFPINAKDLDGKRPSSFHIA